MRELRKIAVLGGGAWGTALALVSARAGRDVILWARDEKTISAINGTQSNPAYLPGVTFDAPFSATGDLAIAVSGCDTILLATPAQTTREMAKALSSSINPDTPVVLCAKGIERSTGALLADVLSDCLPEAMPAVLSGPSFADDVAKKLPTAVTVAAGKGEIADALSAALASESFRPYASTDVIGVQIGGALKNVLAIACGAVVGRGWGASAQAALTARGFREMTRLGTALGARPDTLTGLSGLGDLVLTCSSAQSRNFAFGLELGRGKPVKNLMSGGKLAEGVFTAGVAVDLGKSQGVDLPLSTAVDAVLREKIDLDAALASLMTRPLKRETD
ncbi:NAD(P)-dependent glycerol-3-phosphate dehydrogenase [Rhizobiales bacterium]|uniref:NAD(P)H-dependent glycerol-3-phosphate dehydrogenase n=1 Tax=Hongsoonwoonella zoysiae TaxID=2821844 RepID=UPI0015614D0C|nr:NAD(P)H-dependent glycerol-3-phosphate dehydrogenase [Hongsoonwoonella zoysiae]NRG16887.1 NAD(P)-dependent glycerol-3-phosphate dehydrogenase [Hongsoonwoonella zoysiae]